MQPLLLGVNIDHVATLREARGTVYPDILLAAHQAIAGGADSITIHLREDRRHIQDSDVFNLKSAINVPLNLEMAMTDEMLEIAVNVKPEYCCIVPEKREELTTEGGLDVAGNKPRLKTVCQRLMQSGIRVSLFIDPVRQQLEAASECGAGVIELHTGRYCDAENDAIRDQEMAALEESIQLADSLGIQINAGHGLNYENVLPIARLEHIVELNIGHSIVSQAVYDGLTKAVADMKALMQKARG